jgi:hypothetical protein
VSKYDIDNHTNPRERLREKRKNENGTACASFGMLRARHRKRKKKASIVTTRAACYVKKIIQAPSLAILL